MKTISSKDPAASNTLRAMKFTLLATSLALLAVGCGSSNSSAPTAAQSGPTMSFFVSSAKSTTTRRTIHVSIAVMTAASSAASTTRSASGVRLILR